MHIETEKLDFKMRKVKDIKCDFILPGLVTCGFKLVFDTSLEFAYEREAIATELITFAETFENAFALVIISSPEGMNGLHALQQRDGKLPRFVICDSLISAAKSILVFSKVTLFIFLPSNTTIINKEIEYSCVLFV